LRDEELALPENAMRNALVAKALNYGIFDWDLRKDAVHLDDTCLLLLGLSHHYSVMAYEDYLLRVHPEDRQRIREAIADHVERGVEFSVEYRVRRANGEYRSVISRAETKRNREGKAIQMAGIIEDVTQRKALESQLASMAFHDPLTTLPNRALFMDRLKHALDRSRRQEAKLAVLFVDLDDFKELNDSFGHESGDQALIAVAERLRACLRPGDTVARLGGDEFTVLLERAGDAEARRVAERILDKLGTPIAIEGRQFHVTPSIGVAFSDPTTQPNDLLRNADSAMYEAKRTGKARYEMFHTSMSTNVLERLDLENELRRAIEREEFVIHYQPKVLLEGLKVFAFEALVRWDHPRRGLISPDEFIPAAEETNLILPIDGWVLKEACNQVRVWQEQYPSQLPLRVCINISPRHFGQRNLNESVAKALREAGLDPGCLILEVTENVLMEDSHAAGETLQRLSDLGVSIAIDDFGTAYSSLTRLKHWPIDTLKVDRSFVAGLGEDEDDDVLVSGIINMASGLGLTVVAEGVETSKQLARLRTLGCSRAQGYYFSRPLPPEEIASLLERHLSQ
jgi:diguanylate cyclase (GGDEF)-like protein